MKCYKAFLKEEFLDKWDRFDVKSPIQITEDELDVLVDGLPLTKELESGESIELVYTDLSMVTTCD